MLYKIENILYRNPIRFSILTSLNANERNFLYFANKYKQNPVPINDRIAAAPVPIKTPLSSLIDRCAN